MFCSQFVTGRPVDGSLPADEFHEDVPHGVFCVGLFAAVLAAAISRLESAVASAAPV